MKFFLMLLMIVSMSLPGFAQREFGNKTLAIPHFDSNLKTGTSGSTSKFNVPPMNFPPLKRLPIKFDVLPSNMKKIGELPAKSPMIQKEEFKNPGDIIAEKLNKTEGEGIGKVFRKNQYLGDFRTKSIFLKILCRDYGTVDGDQIRVYINDLLIVSKIALDEDFQKFELTLVKGFNKIDFEAITEGSLLPNTAEFQVYDDQGKLVFSSQWALATQFKATVIIIKE